MLPQSGTPDCLKILLMITLVFVAACSGDDEPASVPPRIALVEPLQVAEPIPEALRFAGVVESVTTTRLAFEVPGRIQRILVDEGERVTRGQPLAELDSTDYELQLREASAQYQQLSADLARKRELLEEGILSPAAIEPLEAGMISAQVARDSARRNIRHTTLKAPFDGVVAQRMAEPDMVVSAGTPVLHMQDNQRIEVGVDLSERAALSLPLGPDLQAEGHLVIADLVLPLRYKEHSTQPRQGSRTYRLILQGEPPEDFNLLPGMAMRVSVQVPAPEPHERPDRYHVPLSALQTAPHGKHFIWLAIDGHARRQDVELDSVAGERAMLRGNVEPGSQVIVAGGSKLSEGQSIQAQQRN